MRWVVGDIQGCAQEFDALLRKIRFDPARDELWSLGDLVNRGPDSLAALRLWRDVGGQAVLGNHDVYALQVAAGERSRHADTLDALLAAGDAPALMERLGRSPLLVHLPATAGGREVWIVHAGVHPAWANLHAAARRLESGRGEAGWFGRADVAFATRARCCDAGGRLCRFSGPPEACPPGFRPWDEFYRGNTWIVHGHWARRGYYRGPRTLGLDSGCVYGGALTAWCQDEDRIVQVAAGSR